MARKLVPVYGLAYFLSISLENVLKIYSIKMLWKNLPIMDLPNSMVLILPQFMDLPDIFHSTEIYNIV